MADSDGPSPGGDIRILVVEDHEMVLDALRTALQIVDSFEVVAAVASLGAAREVLQSIPLDVVVTDLQLPDGQGTELAIEANKLDTGIAVLLITGSDDQKAAGDALESGCAGLVRKTDGFDELVAGVRAVAHGGSVFPAKLLRQALTAGAAKVASTLTDREHEVLTQLARARNTSDIAQQFSLSEHTVRNHIREILAKLGARNQLEAVVIAVQQGIVEIV